MSLENSDEQNHDHLGPASSPERPHSTVTLYRKSNRTTDTLKFEPGARGIDGVAIAFALGAGGADTSHKPPSFKGVRPVAQVREQRVQVGEPNTEPGIQFEGMSPRCALTPKRLLRTV